MAHKALDSGEEKSKFLFPLSTRVQEGHEPCTAEALVKAAGLGAEDLLVDNRMRRGKWTKEEEDYANKIIKNFHEGLIPDAQTGITLRSLLADRLLCDPMRISKKFAGDSCVGKQVYSENKKAVPAEKLNARKIVQEAARQVFFAKVRNQNKRASSARNRTGAKKRSPAVKGRQGKRAALGSARASAEKDRGEAKHASKTKSFNPLLGGNLLQYTDHEIEADGIAPPETKPTKQTKKRRNANGQTKPRGAAGGSSAQATGSGKAATHPGAKKKRAGNATSGSKKKGKSVSKKLGEVKGSMIQSESVLCLQSYIGKRKARDLDVDTTMFHPDNEEEILGVQF
eukprot:g8295.t1